ncbi:alpha/beta hydrolase [Hahella aquimaris]|uniref:alpha/beta fold hydrolase n=1 Tax=Hahella sp. HNIBRBA332 TaxID=3015983 RepID=UPI00273CB799|nr:alpha/beta hydrolase [Hahella sp. HNIBRBA332]WLQ14907.1 alpha/beta hydrolase [Hahella sp. HNIBRBA332]
MSHASLSGMAGVQKAAPESLLMMLTPWEYVVEPGMAIRGWRSRPSGKPVLHFMHGNGFCGLTYEPLLRLLAEHYDLFLSDAQGHGDSDAGDAFRGWNAAAETAYAAWRHFRADYGSAPVLGVGHSFGGVLTTLIAAAHHDAFDQVVALDPVYFTPTMLRALTAYRWLRLRAPNPLAARAENRRDGWDGMAEAREYFEARGMFKGWRDDALQAYIQHALQETERGLTLKCPPRMEAAVFATFPDKLWPSIKHVRQPMAIIYGESSYPFVVKSAQRAASVNHRVRLQMLPGGHCFMQEDPDAAYAHILALAASAEC